MNRSAALRRALPAACLALMVVAPLMAELKPVEEMGVAIAFNADDRTLYWQPEMDYGRLVLTLSGPGTRITREFEAGEEVKLDLSSKELGRLEDGHYKWEIQVIPEVTPEMRRKMEAVREALDQGAVETADLEWLPKPTAPQSGGFAVIDGAVASQVEAEPKPEPRAPQPQTVAGDLEIGGDLTVRGAKHFSVPDPEDPGRRIVYASLEGPEVGTYLRGTASLVEGRAVIELPLHFAKTTEPEGLTVQLTPLDGWSNLFVAEKGLRRLVVEDADGGDGARFDFLIQGVRKGFAGFDAESAGALQDSEVSDENR